MKKDYLNSKSLADGTVVRMFRHIPKNTNSVQIYVPNSEGKKRWITVGYINEARLDDAQFIVHEKTRQKVKAEKKKYVHAFVKGKWRSSWTLGQGHSRNSEVVQVTYNPFKSKYFRTTEWYGGDAIVPEWRGTVYFGQEKSDTIVSPELTVKKGTLTVWKERG